MSKNTYSFLFACDENYLKHMAVALKSLLCTNKYAGINIYFLSDVHDRCVQNIDDIASMHGAIFQYIRVNPESLLGMPANGYLNLSMYYRLLAPELIDQQRVLYLDSDVIVQRSLISLFDVNISSLAIAAIQDPYFDRHLDLEMSFDSHYFNTGVMLMNLDYMRLHDISGSAFEFIKRKIEVVKYPDQDALNHVLNGNWYLLEPTYNLFGYYWSLESARMSDYSEFQCLEALSDPHIVHFTGAKKPWHFVYHNDRFKAMYWFYRNMTPFASRVADDFGFKSLPEFLLNLAAKIKKKILAVTRHFGGLDFN